MSTSVTTASEPAKKRALSLDTWAVIVAFLLALAVRFGIVSSVPW